MYEKVVVTGGGGYIGSHVVEELLNRGYTVRVTSRDPSSSTLSHLQRLPSAADRLEIVRLDLSDPFLSFEQAFDGCTSLIHVAAPVEFGNPHPKSEIIDPILIGTMNALNAASKIGMKKVILTSCFSAVTDRPDPERVFTENDWNETSTAGEFPYFFAKAASERAAWRFLESLAPEKKFTLISLLPQMVIGPMHSPEQSISDGLGPIQKLLKNNYPVILPLNFLFVDVRDLAAAHVNALESSRASGRYIIAHPEQGSNSWQTYEILKKHFPSYSISSRSLDSAFGHLISFGITYLVPRELGAYLRLNIGDEKYQADSTRSLKDLGIVYRDLEQSIVDTANNLIDLGLAPDKRNKKN